MPVSLSVSEWAERDRQFGMGFHWCTMCKQFIALRNFSLAAGTRYGYNWHCKSCMSKRRKGNAIINSKAKRYNRELKAYYKRLLGGTCAKCGYEKAQAPLEFHHVHSEDKEHTPTALIAKNDHLRIMLELDKCILLCRNCHTEFGANCWTAEFIKVETGWSIAPGSIVENTEEYWTQPSDKILYEQNGLF